MNLSSKSNVQTMLGGFTIFTKNPMFLFFYIKLFLFWFLLIFKYKIFLGSSSLLE